MSLKLNTCAKSIKAIRNIEKFIFHIVFWSFAALIFSYVLLLGNMVINIVARQSLEAEARALTNEVRNLEVAYLTASSGVDLALSYSMGFKETQAIFATRQTFGYKFESAPFGSVKIVQNDL